MANRSAGRITVTLDAGTSQFVADLERAKGKVIDFGKAAKGLHGGGFSPRYAIFGLKDIAEGRTKFAVAELINELMRMRGAPLVIGGVVAALGGMGLAAYEIKKHLDGIAEAPLKIAAGFRAMTAPIERSNDELRVANDRLENEISKLEGKRQNVLKLALDEARVSADKLAESLNKDIEALGRVLKEQSIGGLHALFTGSAGTGDLQKLIGGETGFGGLTGSMATLMDQYTAKIRDAKDAKEKDALNTEYQARALRLYQSVLDRIQAKLGKAPGIALLPSLVSGIPTVENDSSRREQLELAARAIREQMDFIRLSGANAALTGQKPAAEEYGRQREAVNRLQNELSAANASRLDGIEKVNAEEQAELSKLRQQNQLNEKTRALVEQIYDVKRLKVFEDESQKWNDIVRESNRLMSELNIEGGKLAKNAFNDVVREGTKAVEEHARALEKLYSERAKIASEAAGNQLQHSVSMAGILGTSRNPLEVLAQQQGLQRAAIMQRYIASLKLATSEEERQNVIKQKNLELDRLSYEYEERKAELRHRTVKDFFSEMQWQAKTAGDILYESMHSALDGVSNEIGRLLTGQKTNFGRMLQQVGGQMVSEGVKSIIMRGLGKLGGKIFPELNKPDGTIGKPYHVIVDNGAPGTPAGAPGAASAAGTLGGLAGGAISGLGGLIKSGVGGLIHILGGIFGGGGTAVSSSISYMDSGGMMSPSSAYIVGENGPELFSRTSGYITSRAETRRLMSTGGNAYYTVDARGADLGAANRLERGIEAAHRSAVVSSVRANADRSHRVPKRTAA